MRIERVYKPDESRVRAAYRVLLHWVDTQKLASSEPKTKSKPPMIVQSADGEAKL